MSIKFDDIILRIGDMGFSLGVVLSGAGALAIFFLLCVAVSAWLSKRKRLAEIAEANLNTHNLEARFNEVSGRLQTMIETTVTSQTELARTLHERFDRMGQTVGQNLTNSAQQTNEGLSKLNERLAVIDTAQQNLTELSGHVVSLQDILANKQARGAFGQSQMETIIRDGLPKSAYVFQPTLSNNNRPDCLIMLPNTPGGIVIDAKFPLEAFRDLPATGAGGKAEMQRVRKDLSKHIKDISEKYFIPGETQDLAMMYVPSDAIYGQLHENFEELINKAYRARIVIVSPNMLMLAIHTMQAVLKDARMREQANLIQIEVGNMMQDVHRLKNRVLDLQKHFGLANNDIEKILISSDKISRRGLRIDAVDVIDDGDEQDRFDQDRLGEKSPSIVPPAARAAGE